MYLLDFEAQEPAVITSQCEETKNVTFIEWKNEEHHLFIGNKKGVVSIVFIDMLFVSSSIKAQHQNRNTFLINLQNRTLTSIRINPILYLESPIVQISNFDRLLLVSTYARCILCDMRTEQFKQVREKQLCLVIALTHLLNSPFVRLETLLGMAITVPVSYQFTISILKCF